MPIYEYRCVQDGSVIELLRPIKDADAPVEDPEGKGREFVRKLSSFSSSHAQASSGGGGGGGAGGGCCPCGKNKGSCSSRQS